LGVSDAGGDANTAVLFSHQSLRGARSPESTAPTDRGDREALGVLLPRFERLYA
jgi:hypothetical protein